MSTLIQPIALLAIILTGYLFKRAGKFKNRDYRIMQVALFNLVLPCAIIYSFATNPHDSSMLWISVFGFVVAFIPPVLIFLTTRYTPVQDRAFTMLNGSGFNIGCFCFPVVQAFLGTAAIVPAAMFDIGNCVMVAAGTNVMTQTLLHIQPGKTLDEQYRGMRRCCRIRNPRIAMPAGWHATRCYAMWRKASSAPSRSTPTWS